MFHAYPGSGPTGADALFPASHLRGPKPLPKEHDFEPELGRSWLTGGLLRFDVEIAPGLSPQGGARVIDLHEKFPGFVLVIEGEHGWGPDGRLSEWAQDQLTVLWREAIPSNPEDLAHALGSLIAHLPEKWRGDEWISYGFSVAAVFLSAGRLEAAAAGGLAIVQVSRGLVTPIFRPPTWVDEQIRAGTLGEADAVIHPLRHVITTGVSSEKPQLVQAGPAPLASGDTVLIFELELFQHVVNQPLDSWSGCSASELQSMALKLEKPRLNTVVRIRVNG